MRRMMSFLTGAMIGGLVGSAVALLLAPLSGNDVRGQIQDRAEHLRSEIRRAATERRLELQEQLEAMRAPQKPSA